MPEFRGDDWGICRSLSSCDCRGPAGRQHSHYISAFARSLFSNDPPPCNKNEKLLCYPSRICSVQVEASTILRVRPFDTADFPGLISITVPFFFQTSLDILGSAQLSGLFRTCQMLESAAELTSLLCWLRPFL